ncbi:hypothetical protein GLE_0318 [Lysobacter enzymogenes]|uniref:Uncharacterized protein n=1 Tax=Lysobacter enzymogenes TaxID=69 RepID=A0A0S2DAV7_LYSEN|nr:hypothetical protein GLE_0318 [Lysobacter enzymogenes]
MPPRSRRGHIADDGNTRAACAHRLRPTRFIEFSGAPMPCASDARACRRARDSVTPNAFRSERRISPFVVVGKPSQRQSRHSHAAYCEKVKNP